MKNLIVSDFVLLDDVLRHFTINTAARLQITIVALDIRVPR